MSDVRKGAVQSDIVADVDVEAILFVYWVITLVLCERVWFPVLPFSWKQMWSDISNHAEHSQDVDKVSMCVLTMNMHHSKDRKHCCENWQFILLLFYDWIAETT